MRIFEITINTEEAEPFTRFYKEDDHFYYYTSRTGDKKFYAAWVVEHSTVFIEVKEEPKDQEYSSKGYFDQKIIKPKTHAHNKTLLKALRLVFLRKTKHKLSSPKY